MTVSSTTNRKTFAGNGVTTSFATSPVVFFDTSDLVLTVVTDSTGASETLVENTDYTVTGGAGTTGTVSLAGGSSPYGAPAAGTTLVIRRVLPLTQDDDFLNNDINDAEVLEDALDRLVMVAQQLDEGNELGVRLSSDETATDALTVLPFDRASKFLAFDASKSLIASSGTVDGAIPVSTFMETVLDDTSAVAAKSTLNASIAVNENNIYGPPTAGASLTSGTGNVLLGIRAGRLLTTPTRNVVIGEDAGRSGTTWFSTVAIGYGAGFSLQDGDGVTTGGFQEVLIGEQAGLNITTGPNNVMIGSSAGKQTTTGGSNVMVGRAAGNDNTLGGFNTWVGHAAGFDYTTGDSNTFVGNQAGNAAIGGTPARTGSDNVAIGELCGATGAALNNTICIGNLATTAIDATTKIGQGQDAATISGKLFSDNVRSTQTNAAGITYTVAEFLQGVILRSGPAGAFSDTTPTAADIVAAIPGCETFTGFNIYVRNAGGGLLTLLAGAGVTLSAATTIAAGNTRMYHVQVTNTTAGAEAVTVTGIFTATA